MLAIIPARGGSKGLPGKNVRELCGRPLIGYAIEEAIKSKFIDRVLVSTDSEEIARIAKLEGAEVPELRPTKLASDNALAIDTYLYTCEYLNSKEKRNIEDFIVLQPTSPLRSADDIDNSISLYHKNSADSVISVVENDHPIQWNKVITTDGKLENFVKDSENNLNRQAYEKQYVPNGAIYIFNYKYLKQTRSYYSTNTFPYIMSKENSIDIDNLFDFELAEFVLKRRKKLDL